MITINEYLKKLIQKSGFYISSEEEKESIEKEGIESYIFTKLKSKKFRKWKLDPECEIRTQKAIHLRISQNEPITVVYPQGGYKLWRLPTSPEADWAEFFNIAYVLQYIAPIAANYNKGVKLIYYLHTLLMEKHDNLTTKEIQSYVDSLQKLIDKFQQHTPKNIKISILKDADIYTREEYFQCLETGKEEAKIAFETWPEERKADYLRMAKLNIKWKGQEDWTNLNEKEKDEKYYLAALYEIAATQNLKRVFEKVKSPENVLVFNKPTKDFIGIGSTKTSIAKYWVGLGILEQEADKFYERVLTPSQYEKVKNELISIKVDDFIDLKNFHSILISKKRLNFIHKI